jgi:hypothetical protein
VDFPGEKNPRANVLDLEIRSSPSLMCLSKDMVSEEQEQKEVRSIIKELIISHLLGNTNNLFIIFGCDKVDKIFSRLHFMRRK